MDELEKYDFLPISVRGEIDGNVEEHFIMQTYIKKKRFEDNCIPIEEREIVLDINNCGGVVYHAWSIIDELLCCEAKIKTVSRGMVASAAVLIALAGDRGARFAYPHTQFLIHQPLGGVQGQAADIKIHAKHIEHTEKEIYSFIAKRTGQSYKKVERACDRDNILDAQAALDFGIIDKIIPYREGKI